jgi:hypothetical protein
MFDDAIQGIDRYNHNGSMWLIFTDEMKWVVEYTKDQTLWYNYYFFKNEMEIIGLDCVDNEDLIQKWFEYRFLNKKRVKDTKQLPPTLTWEVEDTIQNGVKETELHKGVRPSAVEDTIQNEVKQIFKEDFTNDHLVELVVQIGVKHTLHRHDFEIVEVEDTIQNGVKHCEDGDWLDGDERFEDIIQNGTK